MFDRGHGSSGDGRGSHSGGSSVGHSRGSGGWVDSPLSLSHSRNLSLLSSLPQVRDIICGWSLPWPTRSARRERRSCRSASGRCPASPASTNPCLCRIGEENFFRMKSLYTSPNLSQFMFGSFETSQHFTCQNQGSHQPHSP